MTQKRPASSWGRNEPVKRGNSSQLDTPATLQAFENRACKQEGGPDLLQGLKTLPLISRDTWTASFSRQENPPRDRCLKEELFSVVIHSGFQDHTWKPLSLLYFSMIQAYLQGNPALVLS